jgi:hypothetical protein
MTLLDRLLVPVALLLAACTPPPDFESARQPPGPGSFPPIRPLDEVVAAGNPPSLTETDAAARDRSRNAGTAGRGHHRPHPVIRFVASPDATR